MTPMFSDRDLRKLMIPLVLEQVLTALMGMVDTMMVTSVSSAAVSAVSLVDAINTLIQMFFAALATGGTIICSQYMGREDLPGARSSAEQLMMISAVTSVFLAAVCALARGPLLNLIYGTVEQDVMDAAMVYFLITALSYPFIADFSSAAALFRSMGNSRLPMLVSLGANILNVVGNAILIFSFGMGAAGAALSTLISRIVSAALLKAFLARGKQAITVAPLYKIRPDVGQMLRIMKIGIPSGVENCLFQLGRLLIQSTVSTLGTTMMAAQAMISTLEYATSLPALAVGTGVLTVVGRCMGAGRTDEAKRNTRKLMIVSEAVLVAANLIVVLTVRPVTRLAGLETEAADVACRITTFVCTFKVIPWIFAFTLPNTLKAAGDVNFTMMVSGGTMWLCRVMVSILLVRVFKVGLIGMWIGMLSDWCVRAVFYSVRYKRGKWAKKSVLD